MRHRTVKIMVATVAITGVVGAGVATAADPPSCPYGNTPQAGQKAPARGDRDATRLQLRKRDGTGPRHTQRGARNGSRDGQGQQPGPGNRGADCPYRS